MQVRRRRRTAAILNSRPPSQQAGSRPGEEAGKAANKLLAHRRKTAAILAPALRRERRVRKNNTRRLRSVRLAYSHRRNTPETGDGIGLIWSSPAKFPGPDEGNLSKSGNSESDHLVGLEPFMNMERESGLESDCKHQKLDVRINVPLLIPPPFPTWP